MLLGRYGASYSFSTGSHGKLNQYVLELEPSGRGNRNDESDQRNSFENIEAQSLRYD